MSARKQLCSGANSRTGEPCRNYAMRGADKCAAHVGVSAQKSTLTHELVDQLEAVLRAGNYIEVACRATGLPRGTFDVWMQRGKSTKPHDHPYRDFRARVERARAAGEVRCVAVIAAAAPESWQAAAWLLERAYSERWARPSQREMAAGAPQQPDVPKTDDPFAEVDELARRRRAP
jgi:hypothetical protein